MDVIGRFATNTGDFCLDIRDWLVSFDRSPGTFFPKNPKFSTWQWFVNTMYLGFKEALCVLIQLVCFSRTGFGDMFTGSLILFMMLVSFGFPFLSSYLFLVLRLGPWYNQSMGLYGLFRLILQVVFIIGSQLLGGFAAAEFLKLYGSTWAGSGMSEIDSRKNWIFNRLNGTDGMASSRVDWQFLNVDRDVDGRLSALEEGLNTFVFMIGLLHLMEVDTEKLLLSAFFNRENDTKSLKEVSVQGSGEAIGMSSSDTSGDEPYKASSDTSKTLNPVPAGYFRVDKTRILPPVKVPPGKYSNSADSAFPGSSFHLDSEVPSVTNVEADVRRDADGNVFRPHVGIPIQLILHVCLLLAATQRAFPTAHGTPAISVFLYQMKYTTDSVAISRITGGFIGSFFSLLYYYIWYVWPGNKQRGIAESTVNNLIIGPPSFLQSQLQLPLEMDKKH
jgi:hypothetical protein